MRSAARLRAIHRPPAGGGPLTVTLRPNGTVANGSGGGFLQWDITGGASHHAVTADDSDSSYVAWADSYGGDTYTAPQPPSGTLILAMGTFDFTGFTIDSVTLRVRHSEGSAQMTAAQRVAGVNSASDTFSLRGPATTDTGATRTTKPGGGAWDQTAIDGLQVALVGSENQSWSLSKVYEVYADVAYH